MMKITVERAIEILNPNHLEHYESLEEVKEACRMGIEALQRGNELIHCKDCRHMTLEMGIRWCNVWDRPNGLGDDGFCNYAERESNE